MKKTFLHNGIKRFVAGMLCVSLMGNVWSNTINADYIVLVLTEQQEKTNWCWVAAARGLAKSKYNVTKTQSQGVQYIYGSPLNNPGSPQNIVDVAKYFTNFTIPFQKSSSYLSYSEIQTKIYNSNPVVACREKYTFLNQPLGGHAVLIVGFNSADNSLRYCDPEDGEIHIKSYSQMVEHYTNISHTVWEYSVYK